MLPCGWSAGLRFWWQHNVSVVKVFDFKWWFAIRQIGSGPAIFRIMLKGCRFLICLQCKHIKNYCLIPRGNRTAGFIRPAVSSVRAISIRWFCIPYLRPHAGRADCEEVAIFFSTVSALTDEVRQLNLQLSIKEPAISCRFQRQLCCLATSPRTINPRLVCGVLYA